MTENHLVDVEVTYFYGVYVTEKDLPLEIYNQCMKYGGNCIACGIRDYLWEVHKIRLYTSDNGYIYPEKYAIVYLNAPSDEYIDVKITELTKDVDTDQDYAVMTEEEFGTIIELADKGIGCIKDLNHIIPLNTEQLITGLGLLGITKGPSIVCDIYSRKVDFYCDGCGEKLLKYRWNKKSDASYDLCNECYNNQDKANYVYKEICDIKLIHKNRINEYTYNYDVV